MTGVQTCALPISVGDGKPGAYTQQFRKELLDIQYGRTEDKHGWMHQVL